MYTYVCITVFYRIHAKHYVCIPMYVLLYSIEYMLTIMYVYLCMYYCIL